MRPGPNLRRAVAACGLGLLAQVAASTFWVGLWYLESYYLSWMFTDWWIVSLYLIPIAPIPLLYLPFLARSVALRVAGDATTAKTALAIGVALAVVAAYIVLVWAMLDLDYHRTLIAPR